MDSSLDFKAQFHDPSAIKTTAHFKRAIIDCVTRNDQRLFDYLLENYTVSDHEVLFVGSSVFHTGEHTTGETT